MSFNEITGISSFVGILFGIAFLSILYNIKISLIIKGTLDRYNAYDEIESLKRDNKQSEHLYERSIETYNIEMKDLRENVIDITKKILIINGEIKVLKKKNKEDSERELYLELKEKYEKPGQP